MAYAQLALLPVEFGLYSAFMGVALYWFFATSKDITIGPVAVASTLTGTVVSAAAEELPNVPGHVVASSLAVICGCIITFLGLARLGFIVDFISATAVSAFITGAAISILVGQVPALMGISKDYVDNRDATYRVIIDTLKNLGHTQLDAALGLTALLLLYLWRYTCNWLAKKYPSKAKIFFLISTLRTAIVILLYTLVSWLGTMNVNGLHSGKSGYKKASWAILGPVPRGFQDARVPAMDTAIISNYANKLPAVVIVLLIEHVAIAKSFGRLNNYVINPSQELLAIGITNIFGPFVGAYPATGSFSRTAIKSKAGVRTPLAGLYTALVVLLAIYALTAVFFYIPKAALSAVIIHAVGDLILPPNAVYQFWRVNPLEVIIFFAGVLVTIFSTIEDGIYTTVCISVAILLFRLAKARGRFVGKVKVHSVVGDDELERTMEKTMSVGQKPFDTTDDDIANSRTIFLPMSHLDGSNPSVEVQKPYPGVFIYRFSEGFNYPNAGHYMDDLVTTIFRETRRTNPFSYARPGDRPWNNPGPRKGQEERIDYSVPTLRAVILDFSSVNNIDVTCVQSLLDVRNQLDRHAAPDPVEWHFACINNRWTKRGLASAGFGYPTPTSINGEVHRWKPVYSVAEMGGSDSAAQDAEDSYNRKQHASLDIEGGHTEVERTKSRMPARRIAVAHGLSRPLFHLDVAGALQAAIANVEGRPVYDHEASSQES